MRKESIVERLRGCTLLCLAVAALLAGVSHVRAADVEELAADWMENVEISALLEVEASFANVEPQDDSSSSHHRPHSFGDRRDARERRTSGRPPRSC